MTHIGRAADGYQRLGNNYPQVIPSSHFAAASPDPVLATPIQTRPLQGNPFHPLLWNGSATSSTGAAGVQPSLSRKSRTKLTSGVTAGSSSGALSSTLSLSTTLSCASAAASGEGRLQRRVSRDRLGASSTPTSSSTTAQVLKLQRPAQSRMPPSSSSPPASVGLTAAGAGGAVTPANLGRERKVAAANYNALFQQELQQQQQQGSGKGAWPTPSPSPPTGALQYAQLPPSASADVHGTGAHSGSGEGRSEALSSSVTASSAQAGTVEGPLPPDVRRIIAQSCTSSSSSSGADTSAIIDAAEQQARRLISTGRRVKVYREELTAAEEERKDLAAAVEERQLVRSVLQSEVDDINARVQALLQERALVEAQLHAQDDAAAREARKLTEAQDRVTVLRKTIEGIVAETSASRLMLRQLIPSLHIENYY
ncbi:hypothetical protein, conserved [Leishmania donovani]|uniref:Uncharacterized protein n=1 Tax=Leishmania donovani TaxID=5661 RepID=E9BBC5_LEIDO|nr:hypothetical protein, conserved [Leishmania donovani]AYU77129.1 hypothetical protein LdCL_130010500 [Leishmania donovani]CBZ32550.1 hypothetical protein, conserved [Leishmania donovani]